MESVKLDHVVIHPDSGSIVAVADFKAPPERLFRALTAADEITCWWGGAKPLPSILWVGVPLRGTGWRAEGSRMAGRAVFTLFGDFLDVDRPRSVEATWHGSWDGLALTRLSLRLEPVANGSVLTLMHQGFLGRPRACRRQGRLWYLAIRWLTAYFAAEAERDLRRGPLQSRHRDERDGLRQYRSITDRPTKRRSKPAKSPAAILRYE